MKNKTKLCIAALGIGAMLLGGCVTPQAIRKTVPVKSGEHYPSMKEALKVLRLASPTQVTSLNGYKTSNHTAGTLRGLAGLYAGTRKIRKTVSKVKSEKGNYIIVQYTAQGRYTQATHPEALERVLKEADPNRDKIITDEEAEALKRKIWDEYTQ